MVEVRDRDRKTETETDRGRCHRREGDRDRERELGIAGARRETPICFDKRSRPLGILEGTKLKFVTGPRLTHEHGENRARKEDLMDEPENLTPPLQP